MKVFYAFLWFFCDAFFGISTANAACPPPGVQECSCSTYPGGFEVNCKNNALITDIPSWIPHNTTYLEFDSCNIRFLNRGSFKNLVNLTTIKIMNQQDALNFTDSLVFQGLNRLFGVDFDGSKIESLPSALFANLPRLRVLGLNNNRLNKLPDNLLENSSNVQFFSIASNFVDKESIAKIGSGHFGTRITSLLLSGTYIQRLGDNFFSGLPKLKDLGIVGCGIEFIGKDILKGTMVARLILTNNQIKMVDENALRDSQVKDFNCVNCQLTSSVAFGGFLKKVQLNTINLENNNLTNIPKSAFTGLKDLSTIDLSNNKISTIEENPYANLPQCKDADVCIQLDGNPFNCDCNLTWFRTFSDEIRGNKTTWKCAEPQEHSGKSLVSLKVDQFCCKINNITQCGPPNPNTGWVVTSHVMLALVSQILILFGIPLLLA